MTGNQTGAFSNSTQGPRGGNSPLGPSVPRRRRRALIDLAALDAKARQHNAKLKLARAESGEPEPEPEAAAAPAPLPSTPDSLKEQFRKDPELAGKKMAQPTTIGKGAILETDEPAPQQPVPAANQANGQGTPDSDPKPTHEDVGSKAEHPAANPAPAKKTAKKVAKKSARKTTTFRT